MDGFGRRFRTRRGRRAPTRFPRCARRAVRPDAELGEALAREIRGMFCKVDATSEEQVDAGFAMDWRATTAVAGFHDTSTHRCGFEPSAVRQAYARLMQTGKVASITLMSHFARADEPDQRITSSQVMCFERATAGLPGPRSLSNSPGVLCWPGARRDWARCGLALYGVDPAGASKALRPVMSARSEIIGVREIAAGEPVGYGGRYVASRTTRVGLVAFGYADGYPRVVGDGTPVAVDGERVPLIGRVSMDMLTVDLTGTSSVGIGAPVELWGHEVSVNEVADAAGTIPYELLCNAKRARRTFVDHVTTDVATD